VEYEGWRRYDVEAQLYEPSGHTHTLSIVSQPANGSAQVTANKLVYTPASGYAGSESSGGGSYGLLELITLCLLFALRCRNRINLFLGAHSLSSQINYISVVNRTLKHLLTTILTIIHASCKYYKMHGCLNLEVSNEC